MIYFLFFWSAFNPISFNGQLALQTGIHEGSGQDPYLLARYWPEFAWEGSKFMHFRLDAYASFVLRGSQDSYHTFHDGRLYRGWIRLKNERSEWRLGDQKINFGSATLLRPLRWFDQVDPRDPLGITTGVKGMLYRHVYPNNTNLRMWGLFGNADPKGWEILGSDKETPELGGRLQFPTARGEWALSVHRRRLATPEHPHETQYGFDARWDVGIGLWTEIALTETKTIEPSYQSKTMLGMDYTFPIGLTLTLETMQISESRDLISSKHAREISALSGHYSLSVLDQLAVIVFYDWDSDQWNRFLSWSRTYDHVQLHTMVFWNDNRVDMSGHSIQFQLTYNH